MSDEISATAEPLQPQGGTSTTIRGILLIVVVERLANAGFDAVGDLITTVMSIISALM